MDSRTTPRFAAVSRCSFATATMTMVMATATAPVEATLGSTAAQPVFANPVLVGAVTVLVLLVAVFLS
jgi:hypothetical protein